MDNLMPAPKSVGEREGSVEARPWSAIMEHNRAQALRGREILCRELAGLGGGAGTVAAPEEMIAALASVPIPDRVFPKPGDPPPPTTRYHDPVQDVLIHKWGIQAPIVLFPPGVPTARTRAVRIAMQVYNSLEQVEYLARVLKEELAR
jgi:isopenicillin-N epimerase